MYNMRYVYHILLNEEGSSIEGYDQYYSHYIDVRSISLVLGSMENAYDT